MKTLPLVLTFLFLMLSVSNAETVRASVYWEGKHTASGERFRPHGLTAAHRRYPFGTRLLVKYRGRKVVVRINDRGPFIRGRHLDLSLGAARRIGCSGVCTVHIERVK